MENSKKPKVQNMNDFVNGLDESIANTQAIKTSEPAAKPTTSDKAVNNNTAVRQARSQHVSTGMRSAARSSQSANRPSSSRMQTVQLGGNQQASRSRAESQTRPAAKVQSSFAGRTTAKQRTASQQLKRLQAQRHEQTVADPTPMRKSESGSRRYADIREEKRVKQQRQQTALKRSSGGKKKMGKWGKFLIILSAALLVILIVGCIIFSSFLGSYEKGQHSNIAASVVKEFSSTSSLTSYLNKNKDKIHCLEDFDSLVSGYAESLEGKKISYVYDTTSTAEVPKYNITADGTLVGKISMVKDGKGSFGLTKWKVGNIDIASFLPGAKSFNIMVPEGSAVTVNGTALDDSYITNSGVPEVLQGSVKFIKSAPNFVTYTVGGFTKTPEVTATDDAGNSLKLAATESTFMAGPETSTAFVEEVKPLVERGLESWATYFIYMSHNLDLYILPDSEVYKFIFGGDDYDPINPWLYNWEQIVSYDFSEFEVGNFVRYTDDCFTCDVKYHLDITFSEAGMEDNNQNLDATWVWVADGDSWSIADVIYH